MSREQPGQGPGLSPRPAPRTGLAPAEAARAAPPRAADPSRRSLTRFLRIALPVTAALLVLLALLWPQLFPTGGGVGVEVATVDRRDPSVDDAITEATYSGVDGQGRPFSISARRVRNVPEQAHVLLMVQPDAEMLLQDGTRVTIAAANGTYDRVAESLDLQGDVTLTHGPDVTVRTEQATIDLAAGAAEGERQVQGQAAFGTVAGQGFRIRERGEVIVVGGPATLVINPGAETRLP